MPFGIIAGISAGTALFNGITGYKAAKGAAQTQSDAENRVFDLAGKAVPQANDILSEFYKNNMALLAPYLEGGKQAEGQLSEGLKPGGVFNSQITPGQILAQDPGYQFRLDQGRLALDRSASSKGGIQSGGALKALTQYGQDYASQEYGNAFSRYNTTQSNLFNRLSSLAGSGLSATNTGVQAGESTAAGESGNILAGLGIESNAITGAADATAAGTVGGANALTSSLTQGAGAITQAELLRQLLQKQATSNTGSGYSQAIH